jgi:hypothetical protein
LAISNNPDKPDFVGIVGHAKMAEVDIETFSAGMPATK